MRSLVLVGLLVALAAAGCQPKRTEPTTQIYPPETMNGLEPMDDLPPPSEPAQAMPAPIIHPPAPVQQMPSVSAQRTHVVVKNDTLWAVARKYYGPDARREDVQRIIDANPGINPDRIFPGQKIIVP